MNLDLALWKRWGDPAGGRSWDPQVWDGRLLSFREKQGQGQGCVVGRKARWRGGGGGGGGTGGGGGGGGGHPACWRRLHVIRSRRLPEMVTAPGACKDSLVQQGVREG